jgi:hypothetical protein
MSIMQDYEKIRARLEPGEFEAIERYLEAHPDLYLHDIYYNQDNYKKFRAWWKRPRSQSTPRTTPSRRNMQKLYVGPVYQRTPSGYKSIGERTVYADPINLQALTFDKRGKPQYFVTPFVMHPDRKVFKVAGPYTPL